MKSEPLDWTVVDSFYANSVEKKFPVCSENVICKLEQKMQVKFPPIYRQYLRKYNGGRFAYCRIPVVEEGQPSDIFSTMYGIRASHPSYELGDRERGEIVDERSPALWIPVGDTEQSYFIVVSCEPKDADYIYLMVKGEFYWLAENIIEVFEGLTY